MEQRIFFPDVKPSHAHSLIMDSPLPPRAKTKISIITVVYNGADTLERTILSVLKQTYSRIEYIIIDGGSKGGTVDIIKKYQDRIAYWVSESDEGIYDAMNKGMRYASGDWIYFLGSDDILHNVLHQIIPYFIDPDAIYYGDVMMTHSGKRFCGRMNNFSILKFNICHQAIFYPRQVYTRKNYQPRFKVYADYVMNLECWTDPASPFIYLDRVIADYNELGFSGQTDDLVFFQERRQLVRQLFSFPLYIFYLLRIETAYQIKKYCTAHGLF